MGLSERGVAQVKDWQRQQSRERSRVGKVTCRGEGVVERMSGCSGGRDRRVVETGSDLERMVECVLEWIGE